MDVFVANEQELTADESRLAALARHALVSENIEEEAELSVLLVSADHMRRLNSTFADDDYPTDVLSFPMMEDDEEDLLLLGDVVLCPAVAERSAARLNHSLSEELDVLMVHGTLHLLGYDHQGKEDKALMDDRSSAILSSFVAPSSS